MAEHMKDLCEELMDKTNTERKEYFASQGFNIPDNNLTNDTYRKFLYQQVYQGTWPTLSEEFKSLHQLSGDYYIQPYVYDVKKPEDVITFANHHNDIKQGNWNAYLIYHKDEKVWYTGAKPLMLAGKTWDCLLYTSRCV